MDNNQNLVNNCKTKNDSNLSMTDAGFLETLGQHIRNIFYILRSNVCVSGTEALDRVCHLTGPTSPS